MKKVVKGWAWCVMVSAGVLAAASTPGVAQQATAGLNGSLLAQAKVSAESEARLRKAIGYLSSGSPDYQDMEPMLRIAVEQQNAALKSRFNSLGPLQKLEFVGAQSGADVYKATFQNGVTSWAIQISPSGKLATLYFQ